MERRGSGIKKIIKEYNAQYKYSDDMKPDFVSEHGSFLLTLKNLNYCLAENGEEKEKKKGEEMAERMEQVLLLISDEPECTLHDISSRLNISKKQAETVIKKLKDTNRIHRDGSDRNGKWIID